MLKKLIGVCAALLVAVGALAGYGYWWLDQQIASGELGRRISALVAEKTGRHLKLGRISIAGPLSVQVDDVVLEGASPGQAALALKSVQVSVAFDSLLHGKLGLDTITLLGPELAVVRHRDGSTNLRELLEGRPAASAGEPAAAPSPTAPKAAGLSGLPFENLAVRDGKLSFHDEGWPPERVLSLSDISCKAAVPPAGTTAVSLEGAARLGSGTLHVSGTCDPTGPSIQLDGRTSGLDAGALLAMLPASMPVRVVKLPMESRFSIVYKNGLEQADASASFDQGELAVGPRGLPVTGLKGAVKIAGGTLELSGLSFNALGTIPVRASGTVGDLTGARTLDLTLEVPPTELSGLSAPGVPAGATGSVSGKLTVQGPASAPKLQGELVPRNLACSLPVGSSSLPVKVTAGKVAFTRDEAASEGLAVELAGTPAQVDFKAGGLFTDAMHATAAVRVASLPVERAIASLAPEQRAKLEPYHLDGSVSLDLSAVVSPRETVLKGSADATGMSGWVEQAGRSVAFKVDSGRIVPQGDRLTTDGILVSFGLRGQGTPQVAGRLSIAGHVDPLARPPAVALSIRGDRIELAALSAMAGPLPVALEGTTSFSGKVTGSPGNLSSDLGLDLAGVVVRHPSVAEPLVGRGGRVVFDGRDVVFQKAAFGLGKSEFTASGAVEDPAGSATFRNAQVSGTVSLADLSRALGQAAPIPVEGDGRIQGTLQGGKSAAVFTGRGQFPSVAVLMGGGRSKLELENVSAQLEASPAGVKLAPLSTSFYGGTLLATVEAASGKPAVCDAKLTGADFGRLMTDLRNMRGVFSGACDATAKLQVPAGTGLAGSYGGGHAVIRGLVVNGSALSRGLPGIGAFQKVEKFGRLAGMAGTLGGGRGLLGKLGGKAQALGNKYGPMLAFAEQQHPFGAVSYAFEVARGKMAGTVKSEGAEGRISGNLEVDLATSRATGQLDLVAADSSHKLEIANALIDTGQASPFSTRNGLSDFHYSGPEGTLQGPASTPAGEQQTGGVLGNLLGGNGAGKLLGGAAAGGFLGHFLGKRHAAAQAHPVVTPPAPASEQSAASPAPSGSKPPSSQGRSPASQAAEGPTTRPALHAKHGRAGSTPPKESIAPPSGQGRPASSTGPEPGAHTHAATREQPPAHGAVAEPPVQPARPPKPHKTALPGSGQAQMPPPASSGATATATAPAGVQHPPKKPKKGLFGFGSR